jgi:hypothetical protein
MLAHTRFRQFGISVFDRIQNGIMLGKAVAIFRGMVGSLSQPTPDYGSTQCVQLLEHGDQGMFCVAIWNPSVQAPIIINLQFLLDWSVLGKPIFYENQSECGHQESTTG